jgi:hypothetical protein
MGEAVLRNACEGRAIESIRRVFFESEGVADRDVGPVEISFDDGSTVRLDAGGDGEALEVRRDPWVDPFDGFLSTENIADIERFGKWTLFDVSHEPAYIGLLGGTVTGIKPALLGNGKLVGLTLFVADLELSAMVSFDELVVEVKRG